MDRCDGSVREDRLNRRVVLVGLTYTRVDRIGKRVRSPIDNMISQIFRSLSKVVYVGDSQGLALNPLNTRLYRRQLRKAWTFTFSLRFLIHRSD